MKPGNPSLRTWLTLLFAGTTICSTLTLQATIYHWDGGFASNGSWNQAANWDPDGVPTFDNQADLKFTDPDMKFFRNFIAIDRTIRSLEFDNTSATIIRVILGSKDGQNDANDPRNLTFSSDSGNASIVMGADSGADVSIGINAGGFAGSITLASDLDITNDSSTKILTIARSIGETGGARKVTKLGVGKLEFRNSNHTFTGGLFVEDGEIFMGPAATNVIDSSNVVTMGDGVANTSGSLDLRSMNQNIAGLASVGSGGANQVRSTTGPATLTLSGVSGDYSFNGAILNDISLVKSGSATQILSGSNTYSGGTMISGGTLQFAKTNSMSAAGAVEVGTGAILAVNAGGSGEFTNATLGSGSIGGLLAGIGGQGAAVNYTGNVALGIDTNNAGGSLTYSGIIGNVGTTLGLHKLGSGILVLDQANTYTGVTWINSGRIRITNSASLGTTAGNTVVASGAELFVSTNDLSVAEDFVIAGTGTTGAIHIGGNVTGVGFSGGITLSADARIQADGGTGTTFSGGINTAGNTLTFNGSGMLNIDTLGISGNGSVVKTTVGTLNFNAANSHAGSTTFNQGTVSVGASGVLSGSTASLVVNNNKDTGNGNATVLNLSTGANTTVGSLSGTLATPSSGTNTATINIRGSRNLTVNQATDATYQGDLAGNNGSFTLGSLSTHTLTLNGTNNYSGSTTIHAGTLALGANGSIASSPVINLGEGGTLDVSAVSGGFSVGASVDQTLTGSGGVTGAVTIGAKGTHNAGDSGVGSQAFSSSLTYGDASIFEWDLNANSTSGGFDTVSAVGGVVASSAGTVFKVVFGSGVDLDNTFWSTPQTTQTWSMASIFGAAFSGSFANVMSTAEPITQGSFTINGTNLTWTAVPEPSSSLAGLMIAAGLLRRRRA